MADGHLNFCKECVRSRVSTHREANIESIREYDRKRDALPHRRAAVKARAHKYRHLSRRWAERNPHKRKAHQAVGNAIRDGKLTKMPCDICGDTTVHAHHEDYGRPLDVIWLCPKHHSELHKAKA